MLRKYNCLDALQSAGISYEDACALRRISMTLHRWHELECGDGNSYGSWAIARGHKPKRDSMGTRLDGGPNDETFIYDNDGKPYLEHYHYMHGKGRDTTTRTPIADLERGALKRLDKIMARYPGFASYVQGDPRGCALYILRPDDLAYIHNIDTESTALDAYYTRGIAVYK